MLSDAGHVVTWNPHAEQLFGESPEGASCCSLLGCRTPGSPLGERCFSELARESGDPLPEVRVDLADAPVSAVWVSAAPMEGTGIVVQVRPGEAGDRRRRTSPHWVAGAHLRIWTFGATRVESDEGSLGGKWLERRSGQILKYLIAERNRVVHSEEIAEAIWPGFDLSAVNNVRYFIHALREKIEPDRPKRGPSSFVVSRVGGYQLDRERVWIDADAFEQQIRAGKVALAEGRSKEAEEHLREAVALYRGDFLAEEPYAQWALQERDRLQALAAEALRKLANLRVAARDYDGAAGFVEKLAELQPYDIDVHRHLIALAVRRGRRSDAVRRYATLRKRMMDVFDEAPPFSIADVDGTEILPL